MSETFVGVDVGGTKIAAALLGPGGLSHAGTRSTEKSDAEGLLSEIVDVIANVRDGDTAAIGIGVPSVVEFATGRARSSVNVPFADIALREVLGERVGLPVFIDNDATVAALAEAYDGDKLIHRDLVMFTVGTGVGGGLVLDGRPYRGATGAAAELGHMLVGLDLEGGAPDPSGFPQEGSLESFAAGTALDRMAQAAAAGHPDSALGKLADKREVDGVDAVAAAHAGDEVAVGVIRVLGERLGIGIANAINAFDPEVVAIGGGVSKAGDLLLEPAWRTALGFVLPGVGERTVIRLARHGVEAGVFGAALLAKQEHQRQTEEAP